MEVVIKAEYKILNNEKLMECKPAVKVMVEIPAIKDDGHVKLPEEFDVHVRNPINKLVKSMEDMFIYNPKKNKYVYEILRECNTDEWEEIQKEAKEIIKTLEDWIKSIVDEHRQYKSKLSKLQKTKPEDFYIKLDL